MKPKVQALVVGIIVFFVVLFIGFGVFGRYFFPGPNPPEETMVEHNEEDATEPPAEEIFPYRCPFDGTPLKELPLRPVVVAIDNLAAARPQSGLSQADLIYEVPAEGGITRFLAFYYHGQAEKIGPIRSARPYLAAIAQEWQGVFIHVGESPQAQTFFKREDLDHINEMFHAQGFWRERSRKAPHNLYSSSKNLWQEITKKGWDEQKTIKGFSFLPEQEGSLSLEGTSASQVTLTYPSSKVTFKLSEEGDLYQRYIGEREHVDLETSLPLTAANILVQETRVQLLDNEGRLKIDLTGQGRAWLFSRGRVQEGRWVKEGKNPTRFLDETGKNFLLTPGQTWIEIIGTGNNVQYQ
ncbi:DUF3048 domain-containing protein [Dehalobacterium formicoaceticum]|uniref:DUF3048 domain-containing protein n=1 Tax=Dehalobacterium formicoaceticum TaxID=51515 RepID=A0ABT1Y2V9_9FIRM|nr:DUF3048 domain-containing protein [Dehalobacterium formicoaceticum]MCR6544031.1 DUF3048 domain-containing protein [Dehalobacterium formicoaceticum]